ncbi:MAG: hypothetical protein IKE24_09870 [Clostridia bacterium]|nr:hypothetical protein [Clostridia bacterium]
MEPQSIDLPTLDWSNVSGTSAVQLNVFTDRNHNGNQGNGEEGIEGVTLQLVLEDEASGRQVLVGSGETDAKGRLSFDHLPAGTYRVRSWLFLGYGYGEKSARVNSLKDNIMARQSAPEQESELFQVEEGATWSAGIGAVPAATLSGCLFIDQNGDGLRDEDEPGISDQMIEMEGLHSGLIYRTTTDANGEYVFTQLRTGTYQMNIVLPETYRFSRYARSGPTVKGRARAEGKEVLAAEYSFSVNDRLRENQDIGVYEPADLEGLCFLDGNGNGLPDNGEQGFPGVTFTVTSDFTDRKVGEAVSDADGKWRVEDLIPGLYTVQAHLPRGNYTFSVTAEGEQGNRFENTGKRRSESSPTEIPGGETVTVNAGVVMLSP